MYAIPSPAGAKSTRAACWPRTQLSLALRRNSRFSSSIVAGRETLILVEDVIIVSSRNLDGEVEDSGVSDRWRVVSANQLVFVEETEDVVDDRPSIVRNSFPRNML